MILITGAGGKTGKSILNALSRHGVPVRALVRSNHQAVELQKYAGCEFQKGDLRDYDFLVKAVKGVSKIYYICPNLAPDETEIGKNLLDLALCNGVEQFAYHSVLHPQVEAMPHHWQKMRMEEQILGSKIDFTILQPCAYMQNTLAYWQSIAEQGVYTVPYATSARLSLVDLDDVAEAAAIILTRENHRNSIYELAGPQILDQDEIASLLTKVLDHKVTALSLDRDVWEENARCSGLDEYSRKVLRLMFEYYEKHGLVGNPKILEHLIGHPPSTFETFLKRQVEFQK